MGFDRASSLQAAIVTALALPPVSRARKINGSWQGPDPATNPIPTAYAEAVPPHLGRSVRHGPNHPIQGCLSSGLPSALLGLRDATTGCTVHCDVTRPHTGIQWPLFQAPWPSIRVGAAACGALSLATGTILYSPYKLFMFRLPILSSPRHKAIALFAETHRMVFAPLPPLICPDPCSWLEREKKTKNIPIPRPWPLLDRIHALWASFIGPSSGVCSCRMQQTCTKGRLVGSRLALCVRRY